jgi:hypothetical protein
MKKSWPQKITEFFSEAIVWVGTFEERILYFSVYTYKLSTLIGYIIIKFTKISLQGLEILDKFPGVTYKKWSSLDSNLELSDVLAYMISKLSSQHKKIKFNFKKPSQIPIVQSSIF